MKRNVIRSNKNVKNVSDKTIITLTHGNNYSYTILNGFKILFFIAKRR